MTVPGDKLGTNINRVQPGRIHDPTRLLYVLKTLSISQQSRRAPPYPPPSAHNCRSGSISPLIFMKPIGTTDCFGHFHKVLVFKNCVPQNISNGTVSQIQPISVHVPCSGLGLPSASPGLTILGQKNVSVVNIIMFLHPNLYPCQRTN